MRLDGLKIGLDRVLAKGWFRARDVSGERTQLGMFANEKFPEWTAAIDVGQEDLDALLEHFLPDAEPDAGRVFAQRMHKGALRFREGWL